MTFTDWVRNVERISTIDFERFPEMIKNKIRANYAEYCYNYCLEEKGVF